MKKDIFRKFKSGENRSSSSEKKLMSELVVAIVAGIIAGIILLLVTPYVNRWIEKRESAQELKDNLATVSLGMSRDYINGIFGSPLVVQELPENSFEWQKENAGIVTSSAYKLEGCTLLCMYYDNNLVAFLVVVEESNLYTVPTSIYMDESHLLDFTYAEFSNDPRQAERIEGNVATTNDHWTYYYEVHYGATFANYSSFIIGSYKDHQDRTGVSHLVWMGQEISLGDYKQEPFGLYDFTLFSDEEQQMYFGLREKIKPNTFGIVDARFAEEFDFVFHTIGTRNNAELLF